MLVTVAVKVVGLPTTLDRPGVDHSFEIGAAAFFVVVFLVVAGAANAVNLTDGLDGLAAGIAAIVLLSYTGIAFVSDQRDLAIFGATLVGACVGFLWFNSFPAAVFMGDTGSYALGGRHRGHGGHDQDRDPAGRDRRRSSSPRRSRSSSR